MFAIVYCKRGQVEATYAALRSMLPDYYELVIDGNRIIVKKAIPEQYLKAA